VSSVPTHPEARHSEADKAPWHRRLVPAPLKRERVGGQAVRFLIVGLSNTAVDLVIFNLLRLIPGMPDVAAKAVSYFCGIVNSFFWNKYWTFNARGTSKGKREFAVFLAVNLPPLVVNVVVFALLGIWAGEGSFIVRNAKAFGAAVVTIAWNFVGSRYLAFRHTALKKGPGEGLGVGDSGDHDGSDGPGPAGSAGHAGEAGSTGEAG
jgi:putative flippase GtrA